jgi:hypothetical protein
MRTGTGLAELPAAGARITRICARQPAATEGRHLRQNGGEGAVRRQCFTGRITLGHRCGN